MEIRPRIPMDEELKTRKQVQIPGDGVIHRAATFTPTTINEEARTVELVWSSGAQVRRYSWWTEREWIEELSMDPAHCKLDRLNNGAPMLRDHNGRSIEAVIGVTERAWIDGGSGKAVARFAKDEKSDAIFQKVKDGILRSISIGYNVTEWEIIRATENGALDIYRAINWTPMEISLVAIPADDTAKIRSAPDGGADSKFTTTLIEKVRKMDKENPVPTGGLTSEQADAKVREAEQKAQAAERARVKDIREAVRLAKLGDEFADTHIDAGTSIDEVRKLVIAEFGKSDPNQGTRANGGATAVVGKDEREKFRAAAEDAIIIRNGIQGVKVEEKNPAHLREFRGYSLKDLGRRCAENAGIDTRGMTDRELWAAATNRGQHARAMSTSDFPLIMQNVMGKTLMGNYELAPRTFLPFCRRSTVPDFKEVTKVRIGDASPLLQVVEGAEYSYGRSTESAEKYLVLKYGRLLKLTWEAFVNDDLDALARLAPAMGLQVAQLQSDIVYTILTGNPVMGDGTALFHANHGNLAGTATGITETGVSNMRKAFRKQKSMGDGGANTGNFMNLAPKFLIFGPDKEQEALRLLEGVIMPATAAEVLTIRGMGLTPIQESRITGNQWFGAAMPGTVDTIEYSFLRDEPEIFLDQEEDFKVDAISYKVRTTFGAKAIDWKGLYKNAGA